MIVVGLVVLVSIITPWVVVRLADQGQPKPSGAVILPTPTAAAVASLPSEVPPAITAAAPTAAAAPTLSPSPLPTRTPRPTVPPSVTPTATPTQRPPTATPTQLPPTATSTATALPLATVVVRLPTSTTAPTATSTTPPPATRRPVQPTRATVTSVPAPGFVSPPALVSPVSGARISGVVRFGWLPTGPLPGGASYEVVWWNSDASPDSARGFAPPTGGAFIDVNLDPLSAAGQFSGSQLNWTVLVVRTNPYTRLTSPAAGERGVIYYGASGGGGGGGSGSPEPPKPKS